MQRSQCHLFLQFKEIILSIGYRKTHINSSRQVIKPEGFLLEKEYFLPQPFCLNHSNSSLPPPKNCPGPPSHHNITSSHGSIPTCSSWIAGFRAQLNIGAVRSKAFLPFPPQKRRWRGGTSSCAEQNIPLHAGKFVGLFIVLNCDWNFFGYFNLIFPKAAVVFESIRQVLKEWKYKARRQPQPRRDRCLRGGVSCTSANPLQNNTLIFSFFSFT